MKKAKPELRLDVGEGGLEPPNGYPDRFTVCCNCHYATPPRMKEQLSSFDGAKVHLFSVPTANHHEIFRNFAAIL